MTTSKPVAPSELSTFPALLSYVRVMFLVSWKRQKRHKTNFLPQSFRASWLLWWKPKLKKSGTFPDFRETKSFVLNDVTDSWALFIKSWSEPNWLGLSTLNCNKWVSSYYPNTNHKSKTKFSYTASPGHFNLWSNVIKLLNQSLSYL